MARPVLRRGQKIVWLPARGDGRQPLVAGTELLVWTGGEKAPPQRVALDALRAPRGAVLVLDPRDTLLLDATVPPLSGARLRQALPNIVEERLLQDASHSAFAVGPRLPGRNERTVAVVDRQWLEHVLAVFERRAIRVVAVWPAQLAVPHRGSNWTIAACSDSVALRTEGGAFGWAAGLSPEARTQAIRAAIGVARARFGDPERIDVMIDDERWHAPVTQAMAEAGVTRFELMALRGLVPASIDLLEAGARGSGRGRRFEVDWRRWRWSALAALACGLAYLAGLNIHWLMLSSERDRLVAGLEERFRGAFPQAQAVVDPVLQMRRNLSDLRARSGQLGADDFVPLLARLGQALGPRAVDALAAADYRDGRIEIKFQPGYVDSASMREALERTCASLGLRIEFGAAGERTARVGLRT